MLDHTDTHLCGKSHVHGNFFKKSKIGQPDHSGILKQSKISRFCLLTCAKCNTSQTLRPMQYSIKK